MAFWWNIIFDNFDFTSIYYFEELIFRVSGELESTS